MSTPQAEVVGQRAIRSPGRRFPYHSRRFARPTSESGSSGRDPRRGCRAGLPLWGCGAVRDREVIAQGAFGSRMSRWASRAAPRQSAELQNVAGQGRTARSTRSDSRGESGRAYFPAAVAAAGGLNNNDPDELVSQERPPTPPARKSPHTGRTDGLPTRWWAEGVTDDQPACGSHRPSGTRNQLTLGRPPANLRSPRARVRKGYGRAFRNGSWLVRNSQL